MSRPQNGSLVDGRVKLPYSKDNHSNTKNPSEAEPKLSLVT